MASAQLIPGAVSVDLVQFIGDWYDWNTKGSWYDGRLGGIHYVTTFWKHFGILGAY